MLDKKLEPWARGMLTLVAAVSIFAASAAFAAAGFLSMAGDLDNANDCVLVMFGQLMIAWCVIQIRDYPDA